MFDLICDSPYRLGTGENDSLSLPINKRKYPRDYGKRISQKTLTRSSETAFSLTL
ncbi:hypothetical protein [Dehalobacterium formicoaceticum]|uniref:Uncharacterized protein n=1 Tax=Dehalobacterium formicoaceticum TaxID=51515 RepID=A0ABT1Y0C0_9FIRM|nr:hypothetical protein [Dehalobacterium formicoaceticum]MCR6543998.1 hypothetical protein [Dehalobacterium formicoaceticum]